MARPSSKFRQFLVILFLGFVSAEAAARIFSHPPKHLQNFLATEYEPQTGWKLKPHFQGTNASVEYRTREALNSKGIRGPEYSYDKGGEYRVLILGDAHAEGYSAEFEDLFSEVLKKNLNERKDRPYQVINAGVRGYSPDQCLLFFQSEGKKYKPDLTVLFFYADDVWQMTQSRVRFRQKPFFEEVEGRMVLKNIPPPRVPWEPGNFLRIHCHACNFLVDKITHSRFFFHLIGAQLSRRPLYLEVWRKRYAPGAARGWKIAEHVFQELKRETQQAGSRLLVFYVPSIESVYPEAWENSKTIYGMRESEWDPSQDGRHLQSLCLRKGIDFINPAARFQAEAEKLSREGKKLYYPRGGHWTVEGHRLAGSILTQAVSERLNSNSPLQTGGLKEGANA